MVTRKFYLVWRQFYNMQMNRIRAKDTWRSWRFNLQPFCENNLSSSRRSSPFTLRRVTNRSGLDSDEDADVDADADVTVEEAPEPAAEWLDNGKGQMLDLPDVARYVTSVVRKYIPFPFKRAATLCRHSLLWLF